MVSIGVLTPHLATGPEEEFAAMAPRRVTTRVVRVSADAPTTPSSLRDLVGSALDEAARVFAVESTDVVGYASTSTAYAIGFDAEAAMASRLSNSIGAPVASTCASAVSALRVLNVERIALIEPPWFGSELNELGVAYFHSQQFDVVSSESAQLSLDPRLIEPADVMEWASGHVPDEADGVVIGGNGFRTVRAIAALERTLGRPVLTSNQVLLWRLLAYADATFEVAGYGRLFAHPQTPSL
jgi:maleate isomerase